MRRLLAFVAFLMGGVALADPGPVVFDTRTFVAGTTACFPTRTPAGQLVIDAIGGTYQCDAGTSKYVRRDLPPCPANPPTGSAPAGTSMCMRTDAAEIYGRNGAGNWANMTGSGGSVAGSSGQLQGNNAGAFGGIPNSSADFTTGAVEVKTFNRTEYAKKYATGGTGTLADPWVTSGSNPIQAAYNALAGPGVVGGGGRVVINNGVYSLGSGTVGVLIAENASFISGVTIEGEGYGNNGHAGHTSQNNDGAILLYSGAGAAIKVGHYATSNSFWADGITMRGFKLRQSGTAGTGIGIEARLLRFSRIEDIKVADFSTGISLATVSDFNIFDNVTLTGNSAYGMEIGRITDETGASLLAPVGQCNSNRITNSNIRSTARDDGANAWGVYIHMNSVGTVIRHSQFHDFDTATFGAINIQGDVNDTTATVIDSNYFEGNYTATNHNNPFGAGTDMAGVTFTNNYVTQIEGFGLRVNSGGAGATYGVIAQGNVFQLPNASAPYTAARGIQLGTFVTDSRIGPNVYKIQSPLGYTLTNQNVNHGLLGTITEDMIELGTVRATGTITTNGSLCVEGATVNGFRTCLTPVDPTANRTITMPNASGTMCVDTGLGCGGVVGSGTPVLVSGVAVTDPNGLDILSTGNVDFTHAVGASPDTLVANVETGSLSNVHINSLAAIAQTKLASFANSQELADKLPDETGAGGFVRATSPSLVTPTVTTAANALKCARWDSSGVLTTASGDCLTGGGGSVSSVGLSLPSMFTVSNSPVTTSGTLTGTLATQAANRFFVGPSSGAAAAPTFRAMSFLDLASSQYGNAAGWVAGDSGSVPAATATDVSLGRVLRADGQWVTPSAGSVDISGTPASSYIAVWADADTIKGVSTAQIDSSGNATVQSLTTADPGNGSRRIEMIGNVAADAPVPAAGVANLYAKGPSGSELPFLRNATNGVMPILTTYSGDHGCIICVAGSCTVDANCITGAQIAFGSDTIGDTTYYNGTDWVRLPNGTTGQVLGANTGAAPSWGAPAGTVNNNATFVMNGIATGDTAIAHIPAASTVTRIACYTVGGGTSVATVNVNKRAQATPATSGTDVTTTAYTCDTTTLNTAQALNSAAITAGNWLALTFGSVTGTANLVVSVDYTTP